MRTKQHALALFGIAAMLGGQMNYPPITQNPTITADLPKEPKPHGTKEYFFNAKGEFSTEKMLRTECVYKCYALNDKNAVRKFQQNYK